MLIGLLMVLFSFILAGLAIGLYFTLRKVVDLQKRRAAAQKNNTIPESPIARMKSIKLSMGNGAIPTGEGPYRGPSEFSATLSPGTTAEVVDNPDMVRDRQHLNGSIGHLSTVSDRVATPYDNLKWSLPDYGSLEYIDKSNTGAASSGRTQTSVNANPSSSPHMARSVSTMTILTSRTPSHRSGPSENSLPPSSERIQRGASEGEIIQIRALFCEKELAPGRYGDPSTSKRDINANISPFKRRDITLDHSSLLHSASTSLSRPKGPSLGRRSIRRDKNPYVSGDFSNRHFISDRNWNPSHECPALRALSDRRTRTYREQTNNNGTYQHGDPTNSSSTRVDPFSKSLNCFHWSSRTSAYELHGHNLHSIRTNGSLRTKQLRNGESPAVGKT